MLFRKNLGRGHQDGPMTRINREGHGRGGDHGLARADITLEKTVHPVGLPHIPPNRPQGLMLALSEGKGKIAKEGLQESSRRLVG